MSNVAIFKPGETPRYLKSVNTPDYENDLGVIINPSLSNVEDVPLKYWVRIGNLVKEMTLAKKQAVDDAEEAENTAKIEALEQIDAIVLAKALVKAGIVTKTLLVSKIKEVLNG